MNLFDSEYFQKFIFSKKQLKQYFDNAFKDFEIAECNDNPNVIYRFCYDAVIKLGIAIIATKNYKVRSIRGHHIKILETIEKILNLEAEINYFDRIRRQRNIDLYEGGIDFTETDAKNLLEITGKIFNKAKKLFFSNK